MTILLGGYAFDPGTTQVSEELDEVGGRETRQITVTGLIQAASPEAAEAALDSILAEASETEAVMLSIRTGRQMPVRRIGFKREIDGNEAVGAFTLVLEADTPWQESTVEQTLNWTIGESGALQEVTSGGNHPAALQITLVAEDTLVDPSFSDGIRTLTYSGSLAVDSVLVLDGSTGSATLDGEDVLPYTQGAFPRLEPGATQLEYGDDASSSHLADVTLSWRDRWW